MVMLQLEDVLLAVRVVQLDARLLGGQPRLGRLLLADEGGSRGRLCDADARQPGLLLRCSYFGCECIRVVVVECV